MEGSPEAFGSSMAPLAWHDFLERMRHPSAADFVKSIKSFIVSFSNRAPDPEKDSAAVQQFLATMEEAFRAHMLWATSSEEDLESAGEGLEKYVMTKLYNRAFAALPEDVKHDEELSRKMALVQQFICPENLDIKPAYQNETSWLLAQKELQKINMYKAPRDKLVCILNCSKVINNLLLHASISSNDNPPGADEFLPVLIYITMKANPPQLHSNLLYIQRYRRQSRLVSEAAYFFTNILSAESFIWNLDAQSLSMDEAKFQMKMDSARAHLLGLSNSAERQRNQTNQEDCRIEAPRPRRDTGPPQEHEQNKDLGAKPQQISKSPSISELEKKGAADLLKDDQPSKFFQDFPFLFAQAGDLTVDDVESLLSSYKQLVLKYVSLSKGMDSSSISLPAISIEVPESSETSKETSDAIDMEMQLESEGLVGKEKNEISREPENALDMVMMKFKSEGLSIKDDSLDNLLSNADEAESKINVDDSVSHVSTEKDEQFN